jgi:hypothetical protein
VTAVRPPDGIPAPPRAAAPTTIETVIRMLEALGAELGPGGWITRLQVAPGRAPCLYMQNPEPGAPWPRPSTPPRGTTDSEVRFWSGQSRQQHLPLHHHWFWWSWAEPFARDPGAAAAIITRALRSTAGAQL